MTIGLPVYNGAETVPGALENLLAQSHENLEVVVSDNASTDDTAEVVAAYAARDDRVRLVRSPVNVGATENFNRLLRSAGGEYFMWAAADDRCAPDYVASALSLLEAEPDAVICHSEGLPVTAAGEPAAPSYKGSVVVASSVRERWREVLDRWEVHSAIYGLMRTAAAKRSRGLRPVLAGDVVFIAEMAVMGKIIQVPRTLQFKRVPEPGQAYRTRSEMLALLGVPRSDLRAALIMQRAAVTLELVRGVRALGLSSALRRQLQFDAVIAYLRHRQWLIDVKETAHDLRALLDRRGMAA